MRRNVFNKRGMTFAREREIMLMEAIASHFKQLADAQDDGAIFVIPPSRA